MTSTVLLQYDKLDVGFPGLVLLKDATLKVLSHHRYGLVAPNGAGKSTLLSHLAEGKIPLPESLHVLYVAQEAPASEQSALEMVLAADRKRTALLESIARWDALQDDDEQGAEAATQLRTLQQRLHAHGEPTALPRAAHILAGLQFTPAMQRQPTRQFSGGWRMRIALAGALFCQPDLLMLDEPTNHLDLHARIWLEWHLQSQWRGTLLLVSHDRAFLNHVVTDIIHLTDHTLQYYKGDYDTFVETRQQQAQTQQKARKKKKKQQQRLQTMKPGKVKNRRQRQFAKLQGGQAAKQRAQRPYRVAFAFEQPLSRLQRPVLAIHQVSFGFPQQAPLFQQVDDYLDLASRVAIVGPNGSGKTTLLQLIAGNNGDVQPTEGTIQRHRKLRLASFGQHFEETLHLNESPISYLRRTCADRDVSVFEARKWLGAMGLPGKAHLKPIATLSGGQKSRVILASLAHSQAHMLLLDEPTNHLDMESIDALIEALRTYKGGILLVSHNQYLIEQLTETLWILPGDGTLQCDTMTMAAYRQSLIQTMDDAYVA